MPEQNTELKTTSLLNSAGNETSMRLISAEDETDACACYRRTSERASSHGC